MTTVNGRSKGKRGELELFNLLSDSLGVKIKRNLQQSRNGGCDSIVEDCATFPFAIEVKRCEKLDLNKWWQQTCGQALAVKKTPVLAYKQNRKPWRFVVPYALLAHEHWTARDATLDWTAEMGYEPFCEMARELIAEEA